MGYVYKNAVTAALGNLNGLAKKSPCFSRIFCHSSGGDDEIHMRTWRGWNVCRQIFQLAPSGCKSG
jgi:hypothetical protein